MCMEGLRKSILAGSWYPADPDILKRDIEKYIRNVPDREFEGDIVSLVVPHAGYIYSGQVAAYAYKLIQGINYDAIIIVGPSHRVAFRAVSVYSQGAFETPLGVTPIHERIAAEMKHISKIIVDYPAAHAQEHSLEIQLPFLQCVLGPFPIIPLIMGDQSAAICRELASVISQVAGERRILIVASSDLSHFHDYQKAKKLDEIVIKNIENDNVEKLMDDLAHGKTEACGGGPVAVAMLAARQLGARHSQLLKYANSGDVTGDRESVVGYMSAALYR